MATESWTRPCSLFGTARVSYKLKRLKADLKLWNKVVFGNIFQKINETRDKIFMLENNVHTDQTLDATLTVLKGDLDRLLLQEEIYKCQQSRVKWLSSVDKNTAFFHATAKQKRRKAMINSVTATAGVFTKPGRNSGSCY